MAARLAPPPRPIRAAVLREAGSPLRLEELALAGPRPDEALVRLVACGVCHTDIAIRASGMPWPVVLGHEGAGVVEEVGADVADVAPGDHVVLSYAFCGRCPDCLNGRPAHCRRFIELNFDFERLDGSNALAGSGVRGHFFGQSSFATHTVAAARSLVKAPRDLPLDHLAPLGCGIQTGAGTVFNSLAVEPGKSFVVFGAGSVGLAAVMAARVAGAEPVVAVDLMPHRLRLALELGATHALENLGEDLGCPLREILGGGAEYSLDTTGNAAMEELAVDTLNPGGTAAFVNGFAATRGLPGGRSAMSVIQGDAVPRRFIPRLITLYREGRFPFDRLLAFYPLADVNRAMDDSARGVAVKPVLRMPG